MQKIFMVGEQRSGSNLLRLMLNQNPSIACPHPPHILQRITPLLKHYGPLDCNRAFDFLIDDVCQLIEQNPVQWDNIKSFDRAQVKSRCRDRSLIAVFGAVMDIYAEANQASSWLCKSMQFIRWAEQLDAYFGNPKYIYLYRDVRDVVLSFSKAIVGEKHPYFITKQWVELQKICLQQRERIHSDRFISLSYENLTSKTAPTLQSLCNFLGIEYQESMLEFYTSKEAKQTSQSSRLWSNVAKPTMRDNSQKFLKELSHEEGVLIESVAGDVLDTLGYERVYIEKGQERSFTETEIREFHEINEQLKKETKKRADTDDTARREKQLSVLHTITSRSIIHDLDARE